MKKYFFLLIALYYVNATTAQVTFNKTYNLSFPNFTEALLDNVIEIHDIGYTFCTNVLSDTANRWYSCSRIVDYNGNVIWSKTLFGDTLYAVAPNKFIFADSLNYNFAYTGYIAKWSTTYKNLILAKLTMFGDTIWTAQTAGLGQAVGGNIIKTHDGGYACCGWTRTLNGQNVGIFDCILVKFDGSGNKQWEHYYGYPDRIDVSYDLTELSDNSFLLSSLSLDTINYTNNNLLIRTDSVGNELYKILFPAPFAEALTIIKRIDDNHFLTAGGKCFGPGNYQDCRGWIAEMDTLGNFYWDKIYSAGQPINDGVMDIERLADGSIVWSGGTNDTNNFTQAGWVFKTDSVGSLLWNRIFDRNINDLDWLSSINLTSDGGILAGGSSFKDSGAIQRQHAWLLKLDANGCDSAGCPTVFGYLNTTDLTAPQAYLLAAPNPFSDKTEIHFNLEHFTIPKKITLMLQDVKGRIIFTKNYSGTLDGILKINANDLSPGIYFCSLLIDGSAVKNIKIVSLK